MPKYAAEVEFRFDCENEEAMGAALHRLSQVAESAGFEMRRGKVVPAPDDDDDDSGWTGYVPMES